VAQERGEPEVFAASAQCQIQPTQAWCVVYGPSPGILRIYLKDGSARASHEGLDMAVQSPPFPPAPAPPGAAVSQEGGTCLTTDKRPQGRATAVFAPAPTCCSSKLEVLQPGGLQAHALACPFAGGRNRASRDLAYRRPGSTSTSTLHPPSPSPAVLAVGELECRLKRHALLQK
jgi:hypothetical protein